MTSSVAASADRACAIRHTSANRVFARREGWGDRFFRSPQRSRGPFRKRRRGGLNTLAQRADDIALGLPRVLRLRRERARHQRRPAATPIAPAPLARMTHSRQDGRARRLGLSRDTHDSGVAFDLMGSLDDLRDYDQWSSDSAATNFPRRPHARDEATRRCRFPGLVRFRLWCTDGRRCSRLRYLGGFLFCGFGTCGRRLGRVLLETAVLVLAAGAARTRFIAPWPCTGWSSH